MFDQWLRRKQESGSIEVSEEVSEAHDKGKDPETYPPRWGKDDHETALIWDFL